jgi:hypothetical protein
MPIPKSALREMEQQSDLLMQACLALFKKGKPVGVDLMNWYLENRGPQFWRR